jgi:UDP-glucose 4-epimerase
MLYRFNENKHNTGIEGVILRVIITGGAGFVGSALAISLIKDGHEVLIIDNFMTGRPANLINVDAPLMHLDLSDSDCVPVMDDLIAATDVVYHLAASIGVKLVQQKPKETFRNSTRINDNLFPLFEKHNVKVIFSSTSEVYGETKNTDGSKEDDHLEIHPVQKPRGSYACSKLFSEFMIRSYDFPSVIIRFFNVVGPAQVEDYGHVLPRFINCAVQNEDIPIYGDGEQIRSYCDIRDAVEMLKLLLDDQHNGEIYNIGSDENVSNLKGLAQTVLDVTQSKSKATFIPLKKALGENFEEIYSRYPNTDKIKKHYVCKYNLHDIIKNIYETNFNSNSPS